MNAKIVVLIVFLLSFMMPVSGNEGAVVQNQTLETQDYGLAQYLQHEPIAINSDADFVEQGWPGTGTEEDPFFISGFSFIEFEMFEFSIWVSNVRAQFVVSNCRFGTDAQGIIVRNTTNGVFSNNLFRDSVEGLDVLNSSSILIVNNTLNVYFSALMVRESVNIQIINNTIFDTFEFEVWFEANDSIILNNTMYRSAGISIGSEARNNTICYNRFAFRTGRRASDAGLSNMWDDNVSIGNSWSDYNGFGVYEIHGRSGSVDRFPIKWEVDLVSPEIEHVMYNGVYLEGPHPRESFTFEVSVTDTSRIDTVLLILDYFAYPSQPYTEEYEMQHQPSPENPNRYTYTLEGPLYGISPQFSFWANDTLGNKAQTVKDSLVYGPKESYFETKELTLLSLLAGFFLLSISVYVTIRLRKQQASPSKVQKCLTPLTLLLALYLPCGLLFTNINMPYQSFVIIATAWSSEIGYMGSLFDRPWSGHFFGILFGMTSQSINGYSTLMFSLPPPPSLYFISMLPATITQLVFPLLINRYLKRRISLKRAIVIGALSTLWLTLYDNYYSIWAWLRNPLVFRLYIITIPLPILFLFSIGI
ncbi:MAG: right-handed parallel beta-helix repeat-containing protein, partial [Candidatus Thorarchaeota archaeon]